MFRCQVTGKLSKPKEKSVKLISQTRARQYFSGKEGDPERKLIATGTEIVEELMVTQETAALIAQGKLQLRKK